MIIFYSLYPVQILPTVEQMAFRTFGREKHGHIDPQKTVNWQAKSPLEPLLISPR